MPWDPELEEMRRLGYLAVDLAVEHLAGLDSRPVITPPRQAELEALLDEPMPREGHGLEDSLRRFFGTALTRATLVNHPRFFAYIPGPGSFHGAVGEWIAAATNLFVGTWLGGASMAQLEIQTLGWLREAIGLPDDFVGCITSGGSIANLCALAAARERAGPGTAGSARIYLSEEAHYSMGKAARILGFGDEQIVAIPVDGEQRLDVGALEERVARDRADGLAPLFLCATAGTTSTGALDPLADCRDLCDRHGLWLHVDGAYGAAMALLSEEEQLRTDLATADSITLDPHKWLYAPFECGCLLTRHRKELESAFRGIGHYMQDVPQDMVNFNVRGPELTRGNRALKLWMLLRSVGTEQIAQAIRDDLRRCHMACELLAADPRIEVVTPPRMSVFSFALRSGEQAGQRLVQRIQEDGYLMLSSSRVAGRFVLRFCVANHRTRDEDIDGAVRRILELID